MEKVTSTQPTPSAAYSRQLQGRSYTNAKLRPD